MRILALTLADPRTDRPASLRGRRNLRPLFARRMREAFGGLYDSITWAELPPRSDAVSFVAGYKPDAVLAVGKIVRAALKSADIGVPVFPIPHPTEPRAFVEIELAEAAAVLRAELGVTCGTT